MIGSYGSVTDGPAVPIAGHNYTTVALSWGADHATGVEPPVLKKEHVGSLANVLVPDELTSTGGERINRSLAWLQQSHFALTPVHEFMSLMLAFEALSHLLEPVPPRHWQCASCGNETPACPSCGVSTASAGPSSHSMRRYVTQTLKWTSQKWKEVWSLRNIVSHGSHDLSWEEQQKTISLLRPMELAVVSALHRLLRLPKGAPPTAPRLRGWAHSAVLSVTWTAPGDQNATAS